MLNPKLQKLFDEKNQKHNVSSGKLKSHKLFIEISLALSKLRISRGLSQRGLAKLLSTSQPTIARWETPGYDGYSLTKLVEIAEALDYTVELKFFDKSKIETMTSQNDSIWTSFENHSPTFSWDMNPIFNASGANNYAVKELVR